LDGLKRKLRELLTEANATGLDSAGVASLEAEAEAMTRMAYKADAIATAGARYWADDKRDVTTKRTTEIKTGMDLVSRNAISAARKRGDWVAIAEVENSCAKGLTRPSEGLVDRMLEGEAQERYLARGKALARNRYRGKGRKARSQAEREKSLLALL
jgi:hypothetical protein